jgi:hypothetical protein
VIRCTFNALLSRLAKVKEVSVKKLLKLHPTLKRQSIPSGYEKRASYQP